MRSNIQNIYVLLLKITGMYAFVVTLGFFALFPIALANGRHVVFPAIWALIAAFIAITLARPQLLPQWFARPASPRHLIPVLLGNGLLPLLFVIPAMAAVLALELPEPTSEMLSIAAAVPPFLLLGLAWWLGLALCVWQKPGGTPARVVPRRPKMPVLRPEELADLRHQRTG